MGPASWTLHKAVLQRGELLRAVRTGASGFANLTTEVAWALLWPWTTSGTSEHSLILSWQLSHGAPEGNTTCSTTRVDDRALTTHTKWKLLPETLGGINLKAEPFSVAYPSGQLLQLACPQAMSEPQVSIQLVQAPVQQRSTQKRAYTLPDTRTFSVSSLRTSSRTTRRVVYLGHQCLTQNPGPFRSRILCCSHRELMPTDPDSELWFRD